MAGPGATLAEAALEDGADDERATFEDVDDDDDGDDGSSVSASRRETARPIFRSAPEMLCHTV